MKNICTRQSTPTHTHAHTHTHTHTPDMVGHFMYKYFVSIKRSSLQLPNSRKPAKLAFTRIPIFVILAKLDLRKSQPQRSICFLANASTH
jgi:hypothetical protein